MYYPHFQLFSLEIPTWFIFGWLNILLAKAVFVVLVYRRVGDFSQALALVLFYTVGAVIGAILLPSIMGVLGLGILFFLVGKRLLGIRQPAGDLLAIVIALIVGIGRLGCLFNGCCFGTSTHLPWGIHYPLGTPAHWLHFHTGQIASTALNSLAVHPIQLYEAVFLLLAAAVMLKLGALVKNKNTILLGFFGAYLLFRFFIEFIRDMTNVWWSMVYLGPFSAFQWFLLAAGAVFLGSAYLMERRGYALPVTWARPNGDRTFIYGSAIAVFAAYLAVALLHKSLQPIHLIQLVILIPVCTLMLGYRLKQHYHFRLVPSVGFATLVVILLFAPFITTLKAQLKFSDLTRSVNNTGKTWLYTPYPGAMKLVRIGDENISFTRFTKISNQLDLYQKEGESSLAVYQAMEESLERPGLHYYGGLGGGFYSYEVTGCGGGVTTYDYSYIGAMVGVEKVTRSDRATSYIGSRLAFHTTSWSSSAGDAETYFDPSVLVYGNVDFRYVGLGGGGALLPGGFYEKKTLLFPSFYLRLGPPKLHISAGLLDRYMVLSNPVYGHLSLGSVSRNNTRLMFGLTNLNTRIGLFGSFDLKTPSGLRVQPVFILSPKEGVGVNVKVGK